MPTPSHLHQARDLILDWLRAAHREPSFLADLPAAELERSPETIVEHFLKRAGDAGFAFEIIAADGKGEPAFEVHWTYRGTNFVGFKQPPAQRTAEEALLAGSAALLQNQWCCDRLP